jgi:uncharacterized protein
MNPFSLLIKPASADCNLRCAYCFYLDRASLYPGSDRHRMSQETLETLIKTYLATPQPQYGFAWQGGEPTLMGLDFFVRVVELQKKYGASGASVANHLQTNGLAVSEDLARHLARYNFLVGVSLDGPAELHDRFRCKADGRGSHDLVIRGLRVLDRHRVKVNILTLVSSANVGHGGRVYRYLRQAGFDHHQYIPCVEFDPSGELQPFAIQAREWGDFLCQVFDEWIDSDVGRVSVRYFDSLLYRMVSGEHNLCHLQDDCRQYFVVEHNGDVYPCDFFVRPELKLGNINQDSWETLQASSTYAQFGARKRDWDPECAECLYLPYCAADCPKHRLNPGPEGAPGKSWLCLGYKQFLAHALPGLRSLAREIRREQESSPDGGGGPGRPAKVGRNEPCPCGSGRKYKKCCGREDQGKPEPRPSQLVK